MHVDWGGRYFDIGNWGTRVNLANPALQNASLDCGIRPMGQPAPCTEPAALASSLFLKRELMPALLEDMFRLDSFRRGPMRDWVPEREACRAPGGVAARST